VKPYFSDEWTTLYVADVLDGLAELPDAAVHCCVTSPPYWGLRDYGEPGQLGLESTPEEYVENMVKVFRDVRRVLRDDGTLWLNLGDSYNGSQQTGGTNSISGKGGSQPHGGILKQAPGLKPKDLVGIPWRVAFALQADGWWLRSDIIWAKPNPMPESVTDRPTKAHEYIFLLTKSQRYFYDADAVAEESVQEGGWNSAKDFATRENMTAPEIAKGADLEKQRTRGFGTHHPDVDRNTRNRRTVWTIATKPYPEAHFAVFPPELPEICIKAGTSEKGCCPDCGAPWERVVEVVERVGHKPRLDEKRFKCGSGPHPSNVTEQRGWQPTCYHTHHHRDLGFRIDPEPCTVLDPFAGAGTTLWRAKELGRKSIGVELNEEYIKMSLKRMAQGVLAL